MTIADTTVDVGAVTAALRSVETDGVAVVPGVLSPGEAAHALERLWAAADESERRGVPTRAEGLDPNASNVRVWNLIDLDPVFADLIAHPMADALVSGVLGANYIVSNFTANVARPGSGSMMVHSDQSLVMPPPWTAAHSVNVIWCLTDVRADNGATLHLPGSHRFRTPGEVPPDAAARMVPFTAPAGSVVLMEGRVWHTSGANVTTAEDRALLFGFYCQPFLRPQWNHPVGLSPATQARFDPTMRVRLGLDPWLNVGG
jgi:hypothetical protein